MAYYPSEKELQEIKNWSIRSTKDCELLLDHAGSIWNYGIKKYKYRGQIIFKFATGGWSGNESIQAALDQNRMLGMCWESSHRGGLTIYKLTIN